MDENKIRNESYTKTEPMPNELQEEISKKKIKNCIGEITTESGKIGTCFFLNFSKLLNNEDMIMLITNNHVINKNELNKSLKLKINGIPKKFDNFKKRFRYTNEKYDFTVIEILPSDFIDNYLEIDDNIKTDTYIGKMVYIQQCPYGDQPEEYRGKLSNSWGKIIKKYDNKYLIHNCSTNEGSSGSPFILVKNHKVIGLHKGGYEKKYNLGLHMNDIIELIKKENKNINLERGNKEYCYKILKLNLNLKIILPIFIYNIII